MTKRAATPEPMSDPDHEEDEDDIGWVMSPVDVLLGVNADATVHLGLTARDTQAGVMIDLSIPEAEEILKGLRAHIKTAKIIQAHGGRLSEGGHA